jgi:hypothetical protein
MATATAERIPKKLFSYDNDFQEVPSIEPPLPSSVYAQNKVSLFMIPLFFITALLYILKDSMSLQVVYRNSSINPSSSRETSIRPCREWKSFRMARYEDRLGLGSAGCPGRISILQKI